MMARTMMKKGYRHGSGLGKNDNGSVMPLELVENKGRYSLRYKPTWADRRRMIEERVERSRARIEGREPNTKEISLCTLDQSFYSAKWINLDQMSTIGQKHEGEGLNFVHPCLPDEQIGNWEFVDILVVSTRDEM